MLRAIMKTHSAKNFLAFEKGRASRLQFDLSAAKAALRSGRPSKV